MIETVVESIRVSLVTQHRVVILKEVHGERHLPIWIGAYEAEAIAMELQGVTAARPLPYDLIRNTIGEMGGLVDRIVVTDLSQDVFYARIVIQQNGRHCGNRLPPQRRDRTRRPGKGADPRRRVGYGPGWGHPRSRRRRR
jgi:bifunctional DNase/RNase